MVAAQHRLLTRHLEIDGVRAVVGAYKGGMQALQWAVSEPERTDRIVAMTAMARTARWSQLMNEVSRRALFEDGDAFTRPRERAAAMRLWAPLTQLVTPSTPQAAERFPDSGALLDEMAALQARFEAHGPDPFDWLCQTRAYDAHDVADRLGAIRARVLLAAPPLDLYNPEAASHEMAAAIPRAELVTIPSHLGHRAATDADPRAAEFLNVVIAKFLAER
jgi:homoserine O-acetyltransferase